jgi:hypothetical protein
VAGLAVGVGFMAWVSTSSAVSAVSFKDIGFSTVDATQAEIDFQVTREPGAAVKCAVKALDSKFAVVGWKVVDIPPGEADQTADGGRTVSQRVTVRTESLSVSGVVDSCWVPGSEK